MGKIQDLLKAYRDIEKLLRQLHARVSHDSDHSLRQINAQKLIAQVLQSKKRLERKIGNRLLLEKESIGRSLRLHFEESRPHRQARSEHNKR